jgi:hypothetical protein
MTTPELIKRRQQTTNRLLVVVLVLVFSAGLYQFAVINPRYEETKSALCVLRADFEERIARTKEFLAHPEDFPGFDDKQTLALIRQQVEGQKQTVAVLSRLDCD